MTELRLTKPDYQRLGNYQQISGIYSQGELIRISDSIYHSLSGVGEQFLQPARRLLSLVHCARAAHKCDY
ncbi:MAG: hypothetical protein N3E45_08985 [Oscillatoriaceae bacterium SKW80]|nr:hypothetical protein [Oscillatoriaceae bacterium SKYG93]MCX8120950.1 hypothetical protein [Oscillatoriaceae bacterium SKW80]MDW8452223.1 hypothetical protein [Oscillatoriaceae cyanobacterium SKYGB_i_bin93]HIK26558.1 hypothetical protein [Oscillatoriaceae cyanobacterium M7585_C2015_266]